MKILPYYSKNSEKTVDRILYKQGILYLQHYEIVVDTKRHYRLSKHTWKKCGRPKTSLGKVELFHTSEELPFL
jgi:hypothetical protein